MAAILCVLAGQALVQESAAADREAPVALSTLLPNASPRSTSSYAGATSDLFVPVILTASGASNSYYTSELTLTNRGSQTETLHYTYTAATGGGSGTATETLAPGRQKIVPNAIDYLRTLGVPIPPSGIRIGTLRVGVSGSSEVSVTVRTTTQVADGRAGLAYPAVAVADGFTEAVYLCGLRQNRQDRSNVAFQNMGDSGYVTVRATVFSGDSGGGFRVLPEFVLGPGGFRQFNGVLATAGFTQGYVKVERVEGADPFYAYGVINDQANSDGSFVFPLTASSLRGARGQTLPVIIEHPNFSSELIVTNFSDEAKVIDFRFVAQAVEREDHTAGFSLTLVAGEQRILPGIVEALRRQGVDGLGPDRRTLAGAVFATARRGDLSGVVIGARTGSPGGGGQYSVFYNAVPDGAAFSDTAWINALQQNGENRSNLALVNTGEVDDSPSVFQLDLYDGARGELVNTVTGMRVPARGWHQINGILDQFAPGVAQGYAHIRKTSGNNPFLAYGVINDGGAPGRRSGDGAYLPAREGIIDPGTEELTDREVLEAFYHATGGPAWNDRTNWLTAAPLGDWFGVDTDGAGRVTRLNLSRNGLSGTIPPELAALSNLQELFLSHNHLSGPIPPELGSLANLQYLSLSGNPLSGAIPPELGSLASLRDLSLRENRLSGGIPPELGSLANLQWMHFSDNQLGGAIPPELGNLANLRGLDLSSNRLSGAIPPELATLSNLEELSLSGNRLSGPIPPELGSLANLRWLYLWDNRLTGKIPPSLMQLSRLSGLGIHGTRICVPASLQAWLDTLSYFSSSGLPCDGSLRVSFSAPAYEVREGRSVAVTVRLIDQTDGPARSVTLALTVATEGGGSAADYSGVPERVAVTAPASAETFRLMAVEDSHYDHAETVVLGFRRPLPSGVSVVSPDTARVTIIDPGTEELTDREVLESFYQAAGGPNWTDHTNWLSAAPLREWFGVQTNEAGRVTSLELGGNGLSGTIPPALGHLDHLERLNLGSRWDSSSQQTFHNQLSGPIPPELGRLANLKGLHLWGNQLTGAVPPELGALTQRKRSVLPVSGVAAVGQAPSNSEPIRSGRPACTGA